MAGGAIGAAGELGLAGTLEFAFWFVLVLDGVELVEFDAPALGAGEPEFPAALAEEFACAVPAATGTHGAPFALGMTAPG